MTTKICNTCKEDKPLTCFSSNGKKGYKNQCKQCRCNVEKQRRQDNLENFRQRDKAYHEANKEERNLKAQTYREQNREILQEKARNKYEQTKEQRRQRYIINKARMTELRTKARRHRLLTNPQSRIKETLVNRMSRALHRKQRHKMCALLGATPAFVTQWLESMFHDDISWNNYGKIWHIDHVVPIAFFDLTDLSEQLICFHWTNLRPLYAKDNLTKKSKVRRNDIQTHLHIVKSYCEKLERYQTDYENSWWRRLELRYGKNPEDKECYTDILKWVIRSHISHDEEEGSTTK